MQDQIYANIHATRRAAATVLEQNRPLKVHEVRQWGKTMKQIILMGTLLCVFAGTALADPARTASRDGVEQVLSQMERDYSVAYLRHDIATIDRILSDDYVGIDGRAVVSNKAQEIEEAKSRAPGSPTPDYLVTDEVLSDLRVRTYFHAAIVTSLSTEMVLIKGNVTTVRYRRTTVYINRQGRWRCVSFHATRLNSAS